jgi:hypothetical protein
MPRKHEEILEALAAQRHHLAMSSRAYYAGLFSEALRLATTVFIILHDGGKNRSILTNLGIKEEITFLASNPDINGMSAIAMRATPLIVLDNMSGGAGFVPLCTYVKKRDAYEGFRHLPFETWWTKDLIFIGDGRTLNRQQLVLALRNQEGGSHFDEEVRNPNYSALKEEVYIFFPGNPLSKLRRDGLRKMQNMALASMRQIAEEVRLSLGFYEAERNGNRDEHGNLMVGI